MDRYGPILGWIDQQQERLCQLVREWASVNSGSRNLPGIENCLTLVAREFGKLGGDLEWIDLPPQEVVNPRGEVQMHELGKSIRILKRPDAPLRVFLGIHIDTVYGLDHAFQNVTMLDTERMSGPGVADAKGGLAVMLAALEALEQSPWASGIGWEVLINPDEEIGSPGSLGLLRESAARNHLGLLFEPAQEDGALVSQRKGSGNFTVVVHGKAAHAGRNPHEGRSAIHLLADIIVGVNQLARPGVTINWGQVQAENAVNVVCPLAVGRFNVRMASVEDQQAVQDELGRIVKEMNGREGYSVRLHGGITSPPKGVDQRMRKLMGHVDACGKQLGLSIAWKSSGGVCDGNKLAAAGLVNVDSLGVEGGGLHSAEEYLAVSSLSRRAKLSALLLMQLASGEISWMEKSR